MERVIRDPLSQRVTHRVLFESDLCEILDLPAEQLRVWSEVFPKSGDAEHPDRGRVEPVFQLTAEEIDRYQKYAKILKTGVTPAQVREIEAKDAANERKTGKPGLLLGMYAMLAEECPPGVTAHALRSYCVLLFYQNRMGRTLRPAELAKAALITGETATMHLEWLIRADLLKLERDPTRWEFYFVPKALSRYYPS